MVCLGAALWSKSPNTGAGWSVAGSVGMMSGCVRRSDPMRSSTDDHEAAFRWRTRVPMRFLSARV